MRTVHLRLYVPGKPASEVYQRLADFERYPELSECLINDPMSPVVAGSCGCAVAGVLRWAGAGPVFLDV